MRGKIKKAYIRKIIEFIMKNLKSEIKWIQRYILNS